MRKAQFVGVCSRRLGCRAGRLTSLVQRATDAGLLRANVSRRPDFDLDTEEIGRMVLLAAVDEGLAQASTVIERYGALYCTATNSTLESMLGFSLTRPERFPPAHSSLTIFSGDAPSATLTVHTSDGLREYLFFGGDGVPASGVERVVMIGGAALFGIAREFSGASAAEVDALLDGNAR